MKALVEGLDESMRNLDLKGKGIVPSSEYHISMVKSGIRNVDSSQYAPHSILVGPYHCDPDQRMEPVKLEALHGALPGDEQERRSTLHRYLGEIAAANFLAEVRRYYADGANKFEDLALSKLLLVDGFYILHCFGIGRFGGGSSSSGGGMCAQDNIEHIRDVFYLLENQIPFFVLVKIYDLIFPQTDGVSSSAATVTVVLQGLKNSVRPLLKRLGYLLLEETDGVPLLGDSPWHLLHMLYTHFKPTAMSDVTPATVSVEKISRTPPSLCWQWQWHLLSRLGIRVTPAATPADPVYRWRGATQYTTTRTPL